MHLLAISTWALPKQLEILQVSKVHSLEVGNFHFKSMNNLLPVQIVKFFPTSADRVINHSYGLRSRNQIQAPRFSFNSTTGRKSIQYTGSKIWEDLPTELKTLKPLWFSRNLTKSIYWKTNKNVMWHSCFVHNTPHSCTYNEKPQLQLELYSHI